MFSNKQMIYFKIHGYFDDKISVTFKDKQIQLYSKDNITGKDMNVIENIMAEHDYILDNILSVNAYNLFLLLEFKEVK